MRTAAIDTGMPPAVSSRLREDSNIVIDATGPRARPPKQDLRAFGTLSSRDPSLALTIGGGPLDRPRRGTYNFDIDQAASGPILYLEAVPKRIRGYIGDTLVVDSRAAAMLFETGAFPQWYFPVSDVTMTLFSAAAPIDDATKGAGTSYSVHADGRTIDKAGWTFNGTGATVAGLPGKVAIGFDKLDRWLEEDDRVYGEPRDPYHRFDCRRSSDLVEVRVGSRRIARSTRSVKLFETGAPVRYYLPLGDVAAGALAPSATRGYCPYKGAEAYYDVIADGAEHKDRAWTITEPLGEATPLIGYVAFWQEPIEITVEGVPADVR